MSSKMNSQCDRTCICRSGQAQLLSLYLWFEGLFVSRLFMRLAFFIGNQFQLHSPGGEEVGPGFSGAWTFRHFHGLSKHSNPLFLQVSDGFVDIIHVKGNVPPLGFPGFPLLSGLPERFYCIFIFNQNNHSEIIPKKSRQPSSEEVRVHAQFLGPM